MRLYGLKALVRIKKHLGADHYKCVKLPSKCVENDNSSCRIQSGIACGIFDSSVVCLQHSSNQFKYLFNVITKNSSKYHLMGLLSSLQVYSERKNFLYFWSSLLGVQKGSTLKGNNFLPAKRIFSLYRRQFGASKLQKESK